MANLTFQYTAEHFVESLEPFQAPEFSNEEELTMFAASHFYFSKEGWRVGWPIRFSLHKDQLPMFTKDVFILCMSGSKPLFEVV